MRIKEIIAEWHYMKEVDASSLIPFSQANSNVRDSYFRIATAELPTLLGGYFSNQSKLQKLIRGCIQDFINAHGNALTKENHDSLARRITSNIRGIILSNSKSGD